MQLVEQGKVDLDEPASRYSSDFKDDSIRMKHLLSHTSADVPGERFQYDGNRFDYLTAVIEKKTGKPFLEVLVETILDPQGMSSSVPYHNVVVDANKWVALLGQEHLDRYKANLLRLADPSSYYRTGETVHDTYPPRDYVGVSAGLLSTVRDLARYDIAIDRHVFLRKETQERAWTPFVSNGGDRLPYGLGWFVTDYHGRKLVWPTAIGARDFPRCT
jgi:CubicO group peptidase (beta-lactamase class C family)